MIDAKPATDEDIDELREGLPDEPMLSPFLEVRRLASLVARIDTERAGREAAEARVKVLEDALRKHAILERERVCGNGTFRTVGWHCAECEADWDTHAVESHREGCALKEPANG